MVNESDPISIVIFIFIFLLSSNTLHLSFIDVEAEVDEDDEEEPEEEDDLPGEEMHPDDLQELPPGADRDDRMHRELDRQREAQEAMDVEETAARLKERYGRQARGAGAGTAIVPQRLLLPSVNDPRIWRLKCRPGKEREIVFAVQHRIVERSKSREPVQIYSAFERSGPMSGSLYVEAMRQDDIMPAFLRQRTTVSCWQTQISQRHRWEPAASEAASSDPARRSEKRCYKHNTHHQEHLPVRPC